MGWSIILHPGNLLQARPFEQNEEVLLPQVVTSSAKRDWAKSAYHHQSNHRASNPCRRGCCQRWQHALFHELHFWISQSHRHDNRHIEQHRWQCDRKPTRWNIETHRFVQCIMLHPRFLLVEPVGGKSYQDPHPKRSHICSHEIQRDGIKGCPCAHW